FEMIGQLIPASLLGLIARLVIAYTFFSSGRTKVSGILEVTDTTLYLFKEEYALPLIPPEFAAYMATYAEHFFPILLVLGLFTRFAALSLLMMTLVIQLFVYPDAWNVHMWWAIAMLYLIKHGAGRASLDYLIRGSNRQ
ncbi:MAG: DoxX family protein, partial [Sedimenticola sp.]|nr:DoxX family protein [Sedimenticola sp.]